MRWARLPICQSPWGQRWHDGRAGSSLLAFLCTPITLPPPFREEWVCLLPGNFSRRPSGQRRAESRFSEEKFEKAKPDQQHTRKNARPPAGEFERKFVAQEVTQRNSNHTEDEHNQYQKAHVKSRQAGANAGAEISDAQRKSEWERFPRIDVTRTT